QGEGAAVAGMDRLHRGGGAADGILAELGGMGVAGGLASYGAQAETLGRVEAGTLELAVVPAEGLGLAVFEEQLAVVGPLEGVADNALDVCPVESGAREEQLISSGDIGHGLSSGRERSLGCH